MPQKFSEIRGENLFGQTLHTADISKSGIETDFISNTHLQMVASDNGQLIVGRILGE
jgi:hypothetical protein